MQHILVFSDIQEQCLENIQIGIGGSFGGLQSIIGKLCVGDRMKFKTKEELIRGKVDTDDKVWKHGYSSGIDDSFFFFAERVEFYKKYKSKPDLYIKDKQEKHKWLKQFYLRDIFDKAKAIAYGFEYNDWLFDYCFGDVK